MPQAFKVSTDLLNIEYQIEKKKNLIPSVVMVTNQIEIKSKHNLFVCKQILYRVWIYFITLEIV